MATGNPLWDIHDKIWDMLEDTSCAGDLLANSLHFTQLVAANKRKKMTSTVWDFVKDRQTGADFPSVAVVQTGVKAGDRSHGCNATALDVTVEVWVATGQEPAERFWDVQWAIFRQWMNWEAHLAQDTWAGNTYVWNVDLLNSEDSPLLTKLEKTIRGWSCAWRGLIYAYFTPSDLIGSAGT